MQNPPATRAEAVARNQRPRRKPADISTLMARYTARAEERENLAPPPPRGRFPPPEPVAQSPARAPAMPPGPQGPKTIPVPAAARVKNADPAFVASPLPSEPPEAEPGPATQKALPVPAQTHRPAPRPGTIIVSDGQVRVVEAGDQDRDVWHEASPAGSNDDQVAAPGQASQVQPAADPSPATGDTKISADPTGPAETPADNPVSDTRNDGSVAHQVPPEIEFGHQTHEQDPGFNFDDGNPEAGAFAPRPPPEPPLPDETGEAEQWWPPEPPANRPPEPLRFDGLLPYQQPAGTSNLADWNTEDTHEEFEPAWQPEHDRPARRRRLGLFLTLMIAATAGGYGLWSGDAMRLVDLALSAGGKPGNQAQLSEEPVTQQTPEVTTNALEPDPAATPLPATDAPPGPNFTPLASPHANAVAESRLASDPNLKTRQLDSIAAQTSTLWWKPKTVTQFPALTAAEIAGQPAPPAAREEAVMAPSAPLAEPQTMVDESHSVTARPENANPEIVRIEELIRSYAIKDAEAAIEPLRAIDPKNPEILKLSGLIALAKSANFEALTIFDRALAANPVNADALAGRGRALVNLGRATEAIQISDKILSAAPAHPGGLWLGVAARAATGRLDAALEICDRLQGAGAEAGSLQWCRGVANKRARRPFEAEKIFTKALQSGSRDFVALRQLYFRFKGYYTGKIDGFANDELTRATIRCAATHDCDTAGL